MSGEIAISALANTIKLFFLPLMFVISGATMTYSQKPDLSFKRISVLEGLSHSFVKAIIQDHQGFMWFGTDDGLNKYDGYNITIYKHIPEITSSISSSNVTGLLIDANKNLWVRTDKGVDLYRQDTDNFIRCKGAPEFAKVLYEDSKQNVYVAAGTQIFLYDKNHK